MKCPYYNCRKDYNEKSWQPIFDDVVPPSGRASQAEKEFPDWLHVKVRRCQFCHRNFYDIHLAKIDVELNFHRFDNIVDTQFLMSYPSAAADFESVSVPKVARDAFLEAQKCRSVGSLTGAGACLRKTIYAICDDKTVLGKNYREKIGALPVKQEYQDLLKQIKFLGDNATKPGGDDYTLDMVDEVLKVLPFLVDEIYAKDERAERASKLLSQVRSKSFQKDGTGSETAGDVVVSK